MQSLLTWTESVTETEFRNGSESESGSGVEKNEGLEIDREVVELEVMLNARRAGAGIGWEIEVLHSSGGSWHSGRESVRPGRVDAGDHGFEEVDSLICRRGCELARVS